MSRDMNGYLNRNTVMTSCIVIVLSAIIYTFLNTNNAYFSVVVTSEMESQVTVFNSDKNAFYENKRYVTNVDKEGVAIRRGILQPSIADAIYIRLDPVTDNADHVFNIRDPKLSYKDCMIFIASFCQIDLSESHVVAMNQVADSELNKYPYKAQNVDPYIVWKVASHRGGVIYVYLINILLSLSLYFSVLLLCRYLLRQKRAADFDKSMQFSNVLVLLGFYPMFYVLSFLLGNFFNVSAIQIYAYVFSVISFIYFSLLASRLCEKNLIRCSPISVAILFLILSALLPQILFRLGVWDKWPSGKYEPKEYHWQFGRGFQDNFQSSSLKYLGELEEIALLLPTESIFLSDKATSYYVTSFANAYTRNPLRHHRYENDERIYFLTEQQINRICQPIENSINEVINILKSSETEYLVINRDADNKNTNSSCITKILFDKVSRYSDIFDIQYQGEFLALVKINYPV